MDEPSIIIERDGEAFAVRVDPAGAGDQFAVTYPRHKAASGYCRMLSRLRGWTIDDRTGATTVNGGDDER